MILRSHEEPKMSSKMIIFALKRLITAWETKKITQTMPHFLGKSVGNHNSDGLCGHQYFRPPGAQNMSLGVN